MMTRKEIIASAVAKVINAVEGCEETFSGRTRKLTVRVNFTDTSYRNGKVQPAIAIAVADLRFSLHAAVADKFEPEPENDGEPRAYLEKL